MMSRDDKKVHRRFADKLSYVGGSPITPTRDLSKVASGSGTKKRQEKTSPPKPTGKPNPRI